MIRNQSLLTHRVASTPLRCSIPATRLFSTSPQLSNAQSQARSSSSTAPRLHDIDPRWLTMTKRRVGRCMMFGLKPHQIQEAGEIVQQIAQDWRELIAGSEGYLTDATRRGLFRQSVAWGEMDSMGHVNNVTYVRYAETARVYFTRNFALHIDPSHKTEWMNLVSNRGLGIILRSIKVDYKFPMQYPDKVTVYHKLVHDPSSSQSTQFAFHLQVMILSEAKQRPAARCHEDLVTYDYKLGKKAAIPPFLMKQLAETWKLQEQAKKHWQQRILDIEARVRKLETDSWDRVDAVEDTGSAKK
ncbi:thioesterase-like superfamily-domain-containing protein [Aspergillus pseudodeflectus]|uniref:Thioesterase-like superfamily-domain-containing protein n=1 Tax=Aspergillus pseudodeflectus TaxID=176178 RepID=A0ABR4KF36_9EURO